MKEKLLSILTSVSFWLSVIGAVVLILGDYGIISIEIATIVAGWCGFSVTKRTVDKFR